MVFKKCFVRNCCNNSNNTKKIFVHVPHNTEVREKWCAAVQKPLTKTGNLYCCQDHFNTTEDFYRIAYELPVKLKENVVPHLHLDGYSTSNDKSAITESENILIYPPVNSEPEQIIGIAPTIQ